MIAFVVLAILKELQDRSFSIKAFVKDKAFSGLILVFIAILFSGINSENLDQWLLQVKLKLPFLILPIAFYVLRPWIDRSFHKWVHLAFIAIAFISTFDVIVTFLLDRASITASIGKGKSIPTPLDHIHYSIMMAYATVSAAILAISEKRKSFQWLLFGMTFYLFGFMHFLSVRTGLVLSYAGIGLTLLWFMTTHKKYLIGLGIMAFLIAVPFVAYQTVEPFQRKIGYMMWDLKQYQKGKGNSYSDSERLMSYAISFDLIKESPLVGHGIGDLGQIMTAKHLEKYGEKEKYIYPHNQYLYILCCLGLIGALVFFYGLLTPILHAKQHNIFLISIFILMLISFLVENTIQRAVITGFFLFFILLNLSAGSFKGQVE